MLLKEYNKLLEIDELITGLQEQLASLYTSRAALLNPEATTTKKKTSKVTDTLADNIKSFVAASEYRRLLQAWSRYEIEIPAYSQLEQSIVKALDVRTFINKTVPILQGKLKLVLCPPAKVLNPDTLPELHKKQPHIADDDEVQASLLKSFRTKKWRLFLVYGEKEGLYFGPPKEILEQGADTIEGYDSLALGAPEYLALSLQEANTLLDTETHTILPKHGIQKDGTIPAVDCKDGTYHFTKEEADTLFGDVRLRPSINIS